MSAGVGEKTAATLLERFGDLSGIIAAAADADSAMAAGPRRRILDGDAYLKVAPTVVEVARDLAIDRSAITELPSAFDDSALDALAEEFNLAGPLERLTTLLSAR